MRVVHRVSGVLICLFLQNVEAESSEVRYFTAATPSPDGTALAFSAAVNDEWSVLQVQELPFGKSWTLPGKVRYLPVTEGERHAQPVWSADGRRLAYVASGDGAVNVLRVWDRATGTTLSIDGFAPCGRGQSGCQRNSPQWLRNGTQIVLLGAPAQTAGEVPSVAAPSAPVTRTSIEVRSTVGHATGAEPLVRSDTPADIYRVDLSRRHAVRLTSGGRFLETMVSPDETRVLGIQRGRYELTDAKQSYLDLYLIRTSSGAAADMAKLPRLIETRQSLRLISWSPDGNTLAIIENGGLTDGDLLLYSLGRRQLSNATATVSFGAVSDIDAQNQLRDFRYPGTKFGGSLSPPVWLEPHKLFVSRRAREADGWRTSPWFLDLRSGAANKIADITDCDLQAMDPVTFRAVYYCTGETRLYSLESGAPKQLARLAGDRPVSPALTSADDLTLVSESPTNPPEAYAYSPQAAAFTAVTQVNAGVKPDAVTTHQVCWQGREGRGDERSCGALYHAADKDPSTLPIVVLIYPRDTYRPKRTALRFPAMERLLTPPLPHGLVQSGYAVFRPEVSVAGGGNTCDALAMDIENSLAAVGRQKLADIDRAGIIGHSFGGWSVNCIVTRSRAFKAAVSVAGFSDLISLHFARIGQSWARGGGQTSIGVPLSQDVMKYWKESPVSGLSNVSTPLLLIHGKADLTTPYEQSLEMFQGLSDLGKPATLAIYEEATHSSVTAHPDYGPRVTAWFDQYLVRGPGPIF